MTSGSLYSRALKLLEYSSSLARVTVCTMFLDMYQGNVMGVWTWYHGIMKYFRIS